MSPRDWRERIQDIIDSAREIQSFMGGYTLERFRQDAKTIRAVKLNFIIIGEAVNGIPDEVQETHPEVPWHLMRSMRNRLVHVYFEVDPRLMWDTVQNDLPSLISSLEVLRNQI
jgi:uncharacterized protein with HEPN domain